MLLDSDQITDLPGGGFIATDIDMLVLPVMKPHHGRNYKALSMLRVALLVVIVAVISPCVGAVNKTDNRPADGFAHSGYYWPKTILWSAIRRPPGIYWLVYFFYVVAVLYSGFVSIVLESVYFSKSLEDNFPTLLNLLMRGLVFGAVSYEVGLGLLLVGIAATDLSDVVLSYLIGMCMIQVALDSLRGAVNKTDNFLLIFGTIEGLQIAATLGIAMLDSYAPLNKLNAAYWFCAFGIALGMSKVSTSARRYYSLGFAVSLVQMVFCLAAYFVAKRVDGVNHTQAVAFLLTAIFNSLFITGAHATRLCRKQESYL